MPPTTVISRTTIEYTEVCPGNSTLVNGTCVNPPLPNSTIPLPNSTIPLPNATELPPKDNGSDVLPTLPVTEPICDSDEAVVGQPCKDEGDFTDCDPGFRDFGFGCEAVEDTTEEETNGSTDDDDNIEGDDNNNGNNDDFNNDESDNQESDESSGIVVEYYEI